MRLGACPLALTARQIHTPLADQCAIAPRQRHDEIMGAGKPGRLLDLSVARARAPISKFLGQSAVEQH
ncbi:hypothetical protein ASE82_18220 [Sphingomonas sp. Leaf230]|nr:hypothetical protein ASE82_18220 [Sphingomonas sp. Leaf230]